MIKKSIFELADFEEIAEWLSYGIKEYHEDIHGKKCDPELLKHWDKHVRYTGVIGCNSKCHLSGLIIDLLTDEKANQAQLILVDGNGKSPMGDIISPVSDQSIFDEFVKEFLEWSLVEILIATDEVNNHEILSKARFKPFLKDYVVPRWPDYMPPFDEWFEKLYEINDFNKFNEWKSTFRRNNKLM
jgi:hypothetical protein